jgi:non-ribosomal peptide synthase protein (TIGR01720 family)
MKVLWNRLLDGIPSRLLFIFHHSIFDGVSWRIFIEDFQAVYAQLAQQQAPMLLPKTTSYKEWANQLYQYAQTDEFTKAISTWELIPREIPLLPVDYQDGSNRYGDSRNIVTGLSLEETGLLVKEAPGKFHSQVNEIMIGLLARSLSTWIGCRSILIELYGHGREPILSGVDISRTIGWFTTAYPVFLDLADADSITEEIRLVTEQLRRIPDHGISFGMLKYLTEDPQVRTTISAIPSPQVNFNYLGQFDQSTPAASEDSLLPVFPAPESRGVEQNPENEREAQLFVVASVTGGEMNIYWSYSACLHKPETIQFLANTYIEEIRTLLKICKEGK